MASGDTLLQFSALSNEPPASVAATPDQRNRHPVLDFDAAADEEAVFTAIMPQHYAGGGITLKIHFSLSSATTGNVVWQAAFERIGAAQQDLDADGFAAFIGSGQVAVPATSGHVAVATVTFTDGAQIDSVAVGELFRVKVRRDADSTSATDDASGDAELSALELQET